jgi:hypothetical protein
MNLKKIILMGIAFGVPVGVALGAAGVFYGGSTPVVRPPYESITAAKSNQKVAADTFALGAVRRSQGAPEGLRACEGVPNATSIFCFEGYWYAKVLDGLGRGDKTLLKVPTEEKTFEWAGAPGVARDVFVTAYGIALADAGHVPEKFKSSFPAAKDYGHLVDGWIFMRARAIGLQAAAEICKETSVETKPSCEFGVGRAAWFEKQGERWIQNQSTGFKHGYNFAKNFTSQSSASDLEKTNPKDIGEKIAIIDKMLWLKSPAKDEVSVKLYACQGTKHPADCASSHEGTIQ